ncbi:MAG TPA: DNA-directed RNA polymerase subunit beta' [Bacilli bacterium]|nr:DNA-directed RNA polymerase subunit beta' [Bacilli bacterium]
MARKQAFTISELSKVKVGLASPERIREWSHGEVTKPETINYRSQKPETDGLFCEVIFGPSKDYECHCGKYRKIRYKGVTCEKCHVEVISKYVRRERMGHIELASPCTHIWYLKGTPSRLALLLDMTAKQLEEVIYFISHVVLKPGTSTALYYKQFLDEAASKSVFVEAIKEIQATQTLSDFDNARCEALIDRMTSSNQPFDFFTVASLISKYTGAEFGEGAEAVKQLLKEINLDEELETIKELIKTESKQKVLRLQKRLDVVQSFRNSNNKPEWMVLDVVPVIPPDLRPMLQLDGGRFATSDINDLYRRVISRNNRYKQLLQMNAPKVILMNGQRMLQEAVDALIDNGRRGKPVQGANRRPLKSLSSALKGKQGRFRQNLLGKRVDYSGRSVIAVGPELKMYQCGIPREMAVQLFRPFIAHVLIKDGDATNHTQADRMIDAMVERVFDILEGIISEHPVLLNRAPTLHRLGIQAFQPVLVSGRAIRLHPLVCTGFNADFDGDQMAVHVPLSKAAQEEAITLMLASNNILGPKDGRPIATPSQDMVIGNYYLTQEESKADFLGRAAEAAAIGDNEGERLNRLYAESEGRVFASIDEIKLAFQTQQIHVHNRIAVKGYVVAKKTFTETMNKSYLITTVGKVFFNEVFPTDFPYINNAAHISSHQDQISNFVPAGTHIRDYIAGMPLLEPIKKSNLESVVNEVFKHHSTVETSVVLDKIKDQGFKFSTLAGLTVALSDITPVVGKDEIIAEGDVKVRSINNAFRRGLYNDNDRYNAVIKTWNDVKKLVKDKLREQFSLEKRNSLYIMFDSGARGKEDNFLQLKGMRGLMASPRGEIEIPVKANFREGISVSEFFIASHGSRKGGADTALKTADSGYLTRRLVDVAQDVIVRELDCGSDHGFIVSAIYDKKENSDRPVVLLSDRINGRYSVNDIVDPKTGEVLVHRNTMITEDMAAIVEKAEVESVEIRSLFGCETKAGVCAHCYGISLATGKQVKIGDAVGIMAAQSIGEPGTQLTMRTFHTGGVATTEDVTQGLPRVQELLESREPKRKANISDIAGTVTHIEEKDRRYLVTVANKLEEKMFETDYAQTLRVKVGDVLKNGERLTDGSVFPRELLAASDVTTVQNYILNEVQKVYRLSAGVKIGDKHLEVIVKQMLNRVSIIDGGDSELIPGMKVSLNTFTEINGELLLSNRRPAVAIPLILGITKAALASDSFLSAASFQETTRILTDATIKGKTDPLFGLKENVITGKLIPAGRGILGLQDEEDLLEDFDVMDHINAIDNIYENN